MELVELTGPVRVTGDHLLVVPHGCTSLRRGLDHGESVVLESAQGDLYAAQVLDIGFEPEGTVYTLQVGPRLPQELAEERIAGLDRAHRPETHGLGIGAVS
jgi:hypothetical protein